MRYYRGDIVEILSGENVGQRYRAWWCCYEYGEKDWRVYNKYWRFGNHPEDLILYNRPLINWAFHFFQVVGKSLFNRG